MKTNFQTLTSKLVLFLFLGLILLPTSSCEVEATLGSEYTGREIKLNIQPKNNFTVRGSMIIREFKTGGVEFDMRIKNTVEGQNYPVQVFEDEFLTSLDRTVFELTPLDGTTGLSYSTVTEFPNGRRMTFDTLLTIDAHLRILVDERSRKITVAGANMGSNTGRAE